jgi:8-oxo-dGTP diphosphatase
MPEARRFRTLLTARLLLEYREHTLYLLQTPENGGGYTLPGGKIEGEEFAKEGLIREAYEETGIVLTKKALKMVHIMHKRLKSTTEIIFFFRARTWAGEIEMKEPLKFKEAKWLPFDEPPKRLPSVIKAAMLKIQEDKVFSQYPSQVKKPVVVVKSSVTKNSAPKKKKK